MAAQNEAPVTATASPAPSSGPFFTVTIPTYKRADQLSGAIRSVLAQDFTDYELLIVDDGSPDETEKVASQFLAPNVHYFRQPTNLGAGAARNVGIDHGRGEFIVFLDDDDQFEAGFLSEVYQALTNAPATGDLALPGRREVRRAKNGEMLYKFVDYGLLKPAIRPQRLNLAAPIGGGSGLVVRMTTARAVGGFATKHPVIEDRDFIMRVSMISEILLIPKAIIIFNRLPQERFTTNWHYVAAARERFADDFRERLREYPETIVNYYQRAARYFYAIGERGNGRRCLFKALRIRSLSYRTWKLFILLEFNKFLPLERRRRLFPSDLLVLRPRPGN